MYEGCVSDKMKKNCWKNVHQDMFKISVVLWGNSEQCWNAAPLRKMESCERRPEAKAVTQCHMNAMQSTLGG